MKVPSCNPNDAYICLSRKAGDELRRIWGVDFNVAKLKGGICEAFAGDGGRVIEGSPELHFAARLEIKGEEPVVAICVMTNGTPAGVQPHTLNIRGIMTIEDARNTIRHSGAKSCNGFVGQALREKSGVRVGESV